jgi:hypothetical protein
MVELGRRNYFLLLAPQKEGKGGITISLYDHQLQATDVEGSFVVAFIQCLITLDSFRVL